MDVSAIISPIVEALIVPIKKQLGYFVSSTKYVGNMDRKMKELDGKSCDVKKHKDTNEINHLEIPTRVPGWLEEVKTVKEDVKRISSMGNGCFNMKMRYRAGRNASKTTEVIECLIKEHLEMIWSDDQRPLGKVNSNIASALKPSDGDAQNYIKSREWTFKDALESLQQDHTSKVIALCGMGGVGKTTIMEQLKKVVEDKKMFNYVVKVVIGQQINMLSVQQAIAEYTGRPLTETSIGARADNLCKRFEKILEKKEKVLVILDDVWVSFKLRDIGLSSLPNGFKLLLTSRNKNICNAIAVEANSELKVVQVEVMEELEAQNFFCEITGVSKQHDHELNQIGNEIVRKCGFLPLAIKLIATTLKNQENFVWRDTLSRLKKNNLDYVHEIIEISYNCIKLEDEKAIFLICGLFPEDFDIRVEELTRYAWGLRLLGDVSCFRDARDRTKTCVQNLKSAYLLMDSDYIECVKMHDLVLDYVLGRVSKGDHPWVINHGDLSQWSRVGISESCKRISITCMGMSEFPKDFRYPNVSLLRLTDGDRSLTFPGDFYEKLANVEVIAFEKLQYPLLPRSLQCSTKLQTLILNECPLVFDVSAIGELLNLEVLSFADCGITKLPSAIGKLRRLKLLDLTGCVDLRIDDGVLKNLEKLEELYMRAADEKAIRFTDGNRAELAELSKQLSALEVEFVENNGKPENMLFTKLKRFRISMGCILEKNTGKNLHSFENTLILVTNKDELVESGINELFDKTEVLSLQVAGMSYLKELLVVSVPVPRQPFNNLRVLNVVKCADLKYLFTAPMASIAEIFKFEGLKFLSLEDLPRFVGFCNTTDAVELRRLVELELVGLPNFTSIYPANASATSPIMSGNISYIGAVVGCFYHFSVFIFIFLYNELNYWNLDVSV